MIALLVFCVLLARSSAIIPHSKLEEYNSIDAKKIYDILLNFEGKTTPTLAELLCEMSYCHFEDKNKCVLNCEKWDAEINRRIFKIMMSNHANATVSLNVQECFLRCVTVCQSEACKDLCSSLCSTHFSYPNRAEYEREFKHFFSQVMQDSVQLINKQ
ncbi:hypothetical protein PFISCL1PPCAC_9699 [Pristionchus fissidentatus]|uniref:Interleukin n=1 Tax=Pristionchus fissidentatus TaxID=1538716 RepID=A0AAV5VJZ3_9BILA|nr:hypothetical protein PFISCL1PPCAC_9699 [Pristionchus fissidentatus]